MPSKKTVVYQSAVLALAVVAALLFARCTRKPEPQPPVAVAAAIVVHAEPGAVEGSDLNSDAFLWQLLTQFGAPGTPGQPKPAVFETWASDADTFSKNPVWPSADAPKKFQRSALLASNSPHSAALLDVPCQTATTTSTQGINAVVGGFPTTGSPTPCIAEEVKRNKPQFDYIVTNGFNTKAGLAAAFAKGVSVTMPIASISVKGDWVPVSTLLEWIPALDDNRETVRKEYLTYTDAVEKVEYALVSLHVSSRQNPNWVWGTFEHERNPGRCDDLGCYDTFGATVPALPPNRKEINSQYGACTKTPRLLDWMKQNNLGEFWQHYCLKASMVDYAAADGTPYALGNSVTERIVGNGTVVASSCIACHVYASFGPTGAVSQIAGQMLPYNPTGAPIPGVFEGSIQFDFSWGVLLAP
jgi:hypothetical protein